MNVTTGTMIAAGMVCLAAMANLACRRVEAEVTPPPLPPEIPFSISAATVPDSLDQRLLAWEFWRTRKGLADGLLDTTDAGPEARVGLVRLDMFVSPWGSVDSVRVRSERTTARMDDAIRQVVRTWSLGDLGHSRRYRFTVPMSAHLSDGFVGGSVQPGNASDDAMRLMLIRLYETRHTMTQCYRLGEQIEEPEGGDETIIVRVGVTDEGRVGEADVVEATARNAVRDSCLTDMVRSWQFPASASGVYELPIRFAGTHRQQRVTSHTPVETDGNEHD